MWQRVRAACLCGDAQYQLPSWASATWKPAYGEVASSAAVPFGMRDSADPKAWPSRISFAPAGAAASATVSATAPKAASRWRWVNRCGDNGASSWDGLDEEQSPAATTPRTAALGIVGRYLGGLAGRRFSARLRRLYALRRCSRPARYAGGTGWTTSSAAEAWAWSGAPSTSRSNAAIALREKQQRRPGRPTMARASKQQRGRLGSLPPRCS